MNNYQIKYTDNLPKDLDAKVLQGHIADESANGVICNYKSFSLVIKNSNEDTLGVLTAYTAYSEIYVDDIWIEPDYRGIGLGGKLLKELENRFQNKGYNNINLVTSQFQAPDFYKKCGFEIEFVRQNTYNPKLTKFFFIKFFDNPIQTQGILDKNK